MVAEPDEACKHDGGSLAKRFGIARISRYCAHRVALLSHRRRGRYVALRQGKRHREYGMDTKMMAVGLGIAIIAFALFGWTLIRAGSMR